MSDRLVFDSWQLAMPAIGIAIFASVFIWAVITALRMKKPAAEHRLHLPLEEESSRPASHVRPE